MKYRARWTGGLLLMVLLFAMGGCGKKVNIDTWQPNMLLPLLNGHVTAKEISDLKNKKFPQKIPSVDIGYAAGVAVDVPALDITQVGPYPYRISDYFRYVNVDSGDFIIGVQNAFPIPIGAGTKLTFRSSPDTSSKSNIIISHVITRDIPPGGTYTFETILTNVYVTSDVYLYIDGFKSPGGHNVTFQLTPTLLTLDIVFLSVFKVAINTNKAYGVTDTTTFGLSDQVGNYNDSAATGLLHVFLSSSMPVNFNFQMYFLDETKTVLIDSMYYGQMLIAGAHTDLAGVPTDSTSAKYDVPLSADRIRKLKNAKYMSYRLDGDTYNYPGAEVLLGKDCKLQLLITGDLKILVGKFLSP